MGGFRVRDDQLQVVVDGQQTLRLKNLGPDTLYYGRTRTLAAAHGTSLAVNASVEVTTTQWVESAGLSEIETRIVDVERDELIDPSTGKLKETRVPDSVASKAQEPLNAADYIDSATASSSPSTRFAFDLAALVADAEDSGRSIRIPSAVDGERKAFEPIEGNVLLNSSDSNMSYVFEGDGHYAALAFPEGMGTDALFRANKDADGNNLTENYRHHPRTVFRNLRIAGSSSPNAVLYDAYCRSFSAQQVFLTGMKTAFRTDGYTDACRIEQVHAESMTSGGWVWEKLDHGDGAVVDGLFTYQSGGLKWTKTLGASVAGLVGGFHIFELCNVAFAGGHTEGDAVDDASALILLSGCHADFSAFDLYTTTWRAAIEIDDGYGSGSQRATRVTLRSGTRGVQRVDADNANYGATLQPLIHATELASDGRISLRGVTHEIYGHTSGGSKLEFTALVPKITADDSGLSTALATRPALLGGDVDIVYRNGSWEVSPPKPLQRFRSTRRVSTPQISSATASSSDYAAWPTTLTNATYYYKAWIVDSESRVSAASPEGSVTRTTGTVPKLTIEANDAPARLRIVRGTSSGVYTHWAEILIAATPVVLRDLGATIGGSTWSDAAVPTPPTNNLTRATAIIDGSTLSALTNPNRLTGGESTIPRSAATSGGLTMTSQLLRLGFFTAEETEVVTQIEAACGTTQAAATPSLIRYGVYTVDSSTGDLTLVASTASDTALFATNGTAYPKALSSSYLKVAGQRYALGLLVVTGTTAPTIAGNSSGLPGSVLAEAPRLSATVSGQSDLPSSISAGSLSASTSIPYVALLA